MTQLKKAKTLHKIKINDQEIECQLDQKHHPVVSYGGKKYDTLLKVIHEIPDLTKAKNIKALAWIVNFMISKNEYQLIEDIAKFQEQYLEEIEFDANSLDYLPHRLSEHGILDTHGMHDPRIINQELVFFVQNNHNQLPYRASCTYPIMSNLPEVRYQLLPYAKQ